MQVHKGWNQVVLELKLSFWIPSTQRVTFEKQKNKKKKEREKKNGTWLEVAFNDVTSSQVKLENKLGLLNGCHYRNTLGVLLHKEGVSYLFYGYQVPDKMRGHHMASQSQLWEGTTIWVVSLLSSQYLFSWFCTQFIPTFTTIFFTTGWKTETRQTGTRALGFGLLGLCWPHCPTIMNLAIQKSFSSHFDFPIFPDIGTYLTPPPQWCITYDLNCKH